ncbi:curved DNA-binding protein [Senna tora]|uniref:Curved DNA-binding protein n=1 Tax=Senna tora TaxID=362788 RepID=A0A834TWM7_9FABA|nr:curved DNA-binding protein [Senna tora]
MEKSEEAERLLGVAEKLLFNRDLTGSREFAILAQETEPLLEGSDLILAIVEVLLAADNRINNHLDWYAILQIDRRSDDFEFIRKQYRRLALLLHPDKNGFPLADQAFKLVSDAWAVLSDPAKKSLYDRELSLYSKVDLSTPGWVQQDKLPVRRGDPGSSGRNQGFDFRNSTGNATRDDEISRRRPSTFWTACPYCYLLCEYHKIYEGCCLMCQNCERSFHGVSIPTLPPLVPGQDAYYCCWGFFPLSFASANAGQKEAPPPPPGFSNWTPPPVSESAQLPENNGWDNAVPMAAANPVAAAKPVKVSNGISSGFGSSGRKRGRPRKNPLLMWRFNGKRGFIILEVDVVTAGRKLKLLGLKTHRSSKTLSNPAAKSP